MPMRPLTTGSLPGRVCIALVVVLTASACNDKTAARPPRTVTVTATPAATAAQIAEKARNAFGKAPNVRVHGTVKADQGRVSLDFSVRGKNSKGELRGPLTGKKNTTMEFINIGDKHYTRGSQVNWQGPKPPADMLRRLSSQWMLIRGKDVGVMGSAMTPMMMFGSAGAGETLSFGPGHEFEGKPAYEVTDGKGSHFWVSAQDDPLPIAVTSDTGERLDFGYGQAEKITAPANAVDISKQGPITLPG